jgi:hypothetical protein
MKDRTKRLEYQRQYREVNREAIREKDRRYKAANKELLREKKRLYRQANKEKISAYQKRRYAAQKQAALQKPVVLTENVLRKLRVHPRFYEKRTCYKFSDCLLQAALKDHRQVPCHLCREEVNVPAIAIP